MNKSIFIIALLLVFGCTKEQPEPTEIIDFPDQWVLIVNYTAASCYHCGAWGAPMLHDMYEQDKIVVISVHSLSDPMYTPLLLSFKEDRISGGELPVFWVGDVMCTDEENTRKTVSGLRTKQPAAGLEMDYSKTDTSFLVTIKTNFVVASEGSFYLNVYLLEDGIDGSYNSGFYRQLGTLQSYPDDDYTHDFVLRNTTTGNEAYGDKIVKNPQKDEEFINVFEISFSGYPAENVYPVAVLWEYNPISSEPNFKFINAAK